MYAASEVYEAKTNEEIPDTIYDHLKESLELIPSCELSPPYQFPGLLELGLESIQQDKKLIILGVGEPGYGKSDLLRKYMESQQDRGQQILEIQSYQPLADSSKNSAEKPTTELYEIKPDSSMTSTSDNRIYIRNLCQDVTEQDIREVFSTHAYVKQVHFHFDHLGRRRDFAFIEVDSQVDVNTVVKALNGINLMGRKLVVRRA